MHIEQKREYRRAVFLYPAMLAIGLFILTVLSARYSEDAAEERDGARFGVATQRIAGAIEARVNTYIALLQAVRAHIASIGSISGSDFYRYVGELQLQRRYPGIQGIGISLRVRPEERRQLVEKMHREGKIDFRFYPEFEGEVHAIVYLYPRDRRNQVAIGYDMFSEPVRRKAMERARDTGQPAASGSVTLVQEIDERKQAGFLVYVPFYEGWRTPESVEARREQLSGFVYSPFRADDLLEGIFGYETESAVGYRIWAPGANAARTMLHDSELFSTPLPAGYEPRFRSSAILQIAGENWQIEFYTRPPFDREASGSYYWVILGFGTLVAAALGGAAHLRGRYYHELAQSESRFRLMADSAPVLIWISEAGKGRTWFNRSWLEFRGRTLEQELGNGWTAGIHPDDVAECMRTRAAAYEARQPLPMDYRLARHDGEYRWVLDRAAPLRSADGAFVGFIGSCVDITDRKAAEEQREQLLQQERRTRAAAEEASRLKDEFLATLSHELRTPLNAIQGWVQLLLRRFNSQAQLREGLEIVERNVRAQAQIVDDLLDMNRIVSGKVKLDLQDLDLTEIVQRAVETVRPAAEAKGVRLIEDLGRTDAGLHGDAGRLQQVFWNLLANAVKFTPQKGEVRVSLKLGKASVEIVVSDSGEGISPDFLPFVFDRFRQADASSTRRYGGLGLGLAISRQLVEMHGGRIEAQSAGMGRGATFVVSLPLRGAVAPSSGSSAQAAAGAGAEEIDLRGARLLVVDDEPDSRELLREILEEAGAVVTTCASAAEALQRLGRQTFDALISDIAMPETDGHELLRMLRRRPQTAALPAVAVTAFARREDASAALEAGYDYHLAKPVERTRLLQAVSTLLAARR